MTDEEFKKIVKESHEEDMKILREKDKAQSRGAYAILYIIITSIWLFADLFRGETVSPFWLIVYIAGILISLHVLKVL